MPTYEATRELLAPRADVWRFLSEPYNLADWWPGISGLQPETSYFFRVRASSAAGTVLSSPLNFIMAASAWIC